MSTTPSPAHVIDHHVATITANLETNAAADWPADVRWLLQELEAARATIDRVRALHQPVQVPGIAGTSMAGFTKCSCTPGSLFRDCPTANALEGTRP